MTQAENSMYLIFYRRIGPCYSDPMGLHRVTFQCRVGPTLFLSQRLTLKQKQAGRNYKQTASTVANPERINRSK